MPLLADVQVPYVEQAAITLDALASEPAWAEASTVRGFTTFTPGMGQPATGDTVVRLLADAEHLYLFFEAQDPEPGKVRASLGRRDTRWNDDFVGVYLDPAAEAQRAYLFGVTARGALMDGIRVEGMEDGDDLSWDADWRADARRTDTGWAAEVAIPWRILRHPADCDRLGLFLFRHIARLGEKSSWPAIDPGVQGLLVQEAVIGGPGALPPSRGLELVPELAIGWTGEGPANHRLGWNGLFPGVTIRWSPTPESSVLGTFNPDFSQVESDAAQVDVNRRYALYYDEKRPFFLEGREWFQHSFGELVYTRSMVLPLVGARATVEQGGWSVAALSVLDAQPSPSVSEGGGWTEEDLDGHQAAETVLRARHMLGRDGHVGLLLSDREILGTDLGSRLAGVDSRFRVNDQLTGDVSALASQTRFAEGATSWAPALKGELGYSNEHLFAGAWGWGIDPGFRAENGYLTDADRRGGGVWGGAELRPDWKLVPYMQLTPLVVSAEADSEGRLRDLTLKPHGWFQFGNGAGLWLCGRMGGTLWQEAWLPQRQLEAFVGDSWTEWLEGYAEVTVGPGPYYDDPDNPRSVAITAVSPGVTLHPWPWLAVGGHLSWEQALESGDTLYRGWVGRARLDAFATRQLWARLIADTSTFSGDKGAEALLAWERAPGRAIYFGGRTDWGPEGDLAWQVQGKVSWVFSL